MITLKHFFDRPTWAAVAGYDFNIIDCMAEAANRIPIFRTIAELLKDIPNIELRGIWELPLNLVLCAMLLLWPILYPVLGLVTYTRCKISIAKYRKNPSAIVKRNIVNWLNGFDRKGRYEYTWNENTVDWEIVRTL